MKTISKFLLPSIVGISVYLVIHKLFPEEVKNFDEDPMTKVRGGDNKIKLFPKIFRAIMRDRALKIAIITIFTTATFTVFQDEIVALLADDVFNSICVKDTDGNLKIVCDMVEEYDLKVHTKQVKELILAANMTDEHKVSLLKIKLDYIINGQCGGKSRFLIMALLGIVLTFSISGVSGLSLILEALYRLFKEGKISKALYEQILRSLLKRRFKTAIPIEHLNS